MQKDKTLTTSDQKVAFIHCMEEFLFQIKYDVLREELEAALTHLRGVFASEDENV